MSWCRSIQYRQQLKEAVNKHDTVAVERIIQESVELGDSYRIEHWVWVEGCGTALKERNLPMVKLFLSPKSIANNFVEVSAHVQLMKAAIESDFTEGVNFLHSIGVPLFIPRLISGCDWSALIECVEENKVGVLQYLLTLKDLDINPDKEETLLMICCHELSIGSLEVLLNSKLINTINEQEAKSQYSALHFCIGGRKCEFWGSGCYNRCKREVLACVKLLVEAGAEVNLQDINGTTPIQLAAERAMVTTVIYLAHRGANLDIVNRHGTLLHCLAMSEGRLDFYNESYDECVQSLITHGMDINQHNSSNQTPLYLAVICENLEMVKSLIKSHCDVDIKGGVDMTPILLKSMRSTQTAITDKLIQAGCDVNSADSSGVTPLLESIRQYKTAIAEILIEAGCDVNIPDKNGVTPLMECVKKNNCDLVKQLIASGASVNAKDSKKCYVLDYLFRSYHHHFSSADIVKIMIEAGADIHKCDNLLYRAFYDEDYKTASVLIEHGIDVNAVDRHGDNPLAVASEEGKLELVELLTTKDCDINHQNLKGQTALHKVMQDWRYSEDDEIKEKIIKTLLLQNGINVNLSDVDGYTALSMAVRNEKTFITEDLLKAGADLKPRDVIGRNVIFLAAFFNNGSLVLDVLLKFANLRGDTGSIVNATDKDGTTPFMVAAERGSKDMVEKLLTAGCNINLQDHGGKTALMFAVDNEDETILSLLLQNGADHNIGDNNGKTTLMVAVEKQRETHCENLLKSGASVNQVDKNTALAIAVTMYSMDIVNSLLKAGAGVNQRDYFEVTPLMNVNNRSICESLLTAGADINQSDSNGKTALMTAARNCNRSLLECLLYAGADVNKTDTDGKSAIHYIMVGDRGGRKWINCLKLLLIHKCHVSLNTPGEDGKTLFEGLLETNAIDLIWYLLTENCPLKGLNLSKVKDKFPDTVMISKILFESGAEQSELKIIIESEDKKQIDFRNFCNTRSLKSRCRREIRNCIGPGISSKITHDQIDLPKYLQDYVVMKDLIPEKYFTLVLNDEDDYDYYDSNYDNYYSSYSDDSSD